MKALTLNRSWAVSLVLGLVLSLISLLYLASPYGEDSIVSRPQLRLPGPTIQLTHTPDEDVPESVPQSTNFPFDGHLICTQSFVGKYWGFPAAIVSLEGSDGCANDKFLNILGLIFNIAFYGVVSRMVIFAWQRSRR